MEKRDLTPSVLAKEHGLTMKDVKRITGKHGSTLVRWCKVDRPLFMVVLKGCQKIKKGEIE